MATNAIHCTLLDGFRETWVRGHLDRQRAEDDLEAAKNALRRFLGREVDDEQRGVAETNLEEAERRLREIQTVLIDRFDRFCGAPK